MSDASDASDLAVAVLPQHLSGAGRIATSADLRHRHLAEVLWYLRANGPTGRVATAAGCHIAPSTMTDLVHELKSRKLILELPAVRGGVGRPKQPIAIDGSPWCVAGVHLTPKTVVSVGVTLGGKRVWHQRDELVSNRSDPATVVRQLGSILARRVRALPRGKHLVGVGVALPEYLASVDLGPVLGAALAAQDECLTEPLTWTEPVQPSTAAPTRRYRVHAYWPADEVSVPGD